MLPHPHLIHKRYVGFENKLYYNLKYFFCRGSPVDIFLHDSPVFSLSLHPDNGNIFASAANNGRILIYDIRESNTGGSALKRIEVVCHLLVFIYVNNSENKNFQIYFVLQN